GSRLHHHGGRLDHRGRRAARLEAELLDGVAGHDRDDPARLGDEDLDLCQQALHLHLADGAGETVARADVPRPVVAAEARDLPAADDTAVRGVAPGADATVTVPAAQRVEADAERLRRLAGAVNVLRHER